MPLYEYQCENCGETTEVLQKFSDAPLSDCPNCGGHVSKLMSMNSFQLKGSGWYVTDYAGKSGQAKTDAAKAPAAGAGAGKEGSADKKSATPKEATSSTKDKAPVKA